MSRINIRNLRQTGPLDASEMKTVCGGIVTTGPVTPVGMLGIVASGPVMPKDMLGIVASGPVRPVQQ